MAIDSGIEWRDVPGYEGVQVTEGGCVRSFWGTENLGRGRGTRRVLKPQPRELRIHTNSQGYQFVILSRVSRALVHRLVLAAFVGPCPSDHEARHLNGVRDDNRLANLAWGTPLENHADQYRHGTREAGQRHHRAKLTTAQVIAARMLAAAGWKQHAIADLFGVRQPTISSLVNRRHRITAPQEAA